MSNADVLRAMSDEELAEWMKYSGAGCPDGHFVGDYGCRHCEECWLDWLKSPVEDET